MHNLNPRDLLLEIYNHALNAVNGRQCVFEHVQSMTFDLNAPIYLVALGKAAVSMADGAQAALAEKGLVITSGLVVTKAAHHRNEPLDNIKVLEAGHPIPTQESLDAGDELIEFVSTIPPNAHFIALVSGGTSALVEKLREPLQLEHLQQLNTLLMQFGLTIEQMNHYRQAMSQIKNGGLLKLISAEKVIVLYLSDVPGNDIGVIGSGLFNDNPKDLRLDGIPPSCMPSWFFVLTGASDELPVRHDVTVTHTVLADNEKAKMAAIDYAREQGLNAHLFEDVALQPYTQFQKHMLNTMVNQPNALIVGGGEVSVPLPQTPGRGGRCQSLGLAMAIDIQNRNGLYFLAAGTDGSDGPCDEAGALVDADSITRGLIGEADSLDAEECLATANANPFLSASGDLIYTGPTGTNVMDLYLGLYCPQSSV